jgi:hypothetical protein
MVAAVAYWALQVVSGSDIADVTDVTGQKRMSADQAVQWQVVNVQGIMQVDNG